MDICFILDDSGSIEYNGYGNWQRMLDFVISVVSSLNIGPNGVHVALVKFDTTAEVEFYLNDYTDSANIIRRINSTHYDGLSTNIAAGFNLTTTQIFTQAKGKRQGVPLVAVLITDGRAVLDTSQTIPSARIAKNMGIRIIAVGVTSDIDLAELQNIASTPADVYNVSDYRFLSTVVTKLQENFNGDCVVAAPTTTTLAPPPPAQVTVTGIEFLSLFSFSSFVLTDRNSANRVLR